VAALERTLDQMIESNTCYNKSFKPVNEKRAFEERVKLREKLDKAYDRLKFKRQEERGIVGDVLQAEGRQKQLAEEEMGLLHAVQQLEQRREEASTSIQVGKHLSALLQAQEVTV
jgi:coiled-coil domain-containing protein 39